ncbi:phage tail protein [Stenotrophomonas sp. YAU14D1_LEIMI4_1]|uniref:phage tail protein n=1 Tax=Stenotrophomonas sp. YAU14D1_LEIMI4_1 TaxID=2072407 RepID=UPI000D542734|nr:phage tail protein [Stenotrophomonas sp. YAU14D1_LEIMI4_1]AWH25725.1 phage tail protein [Stenotrophomonas sp. YAU14D1_LEIMI4_1]
MSLYTLTVDLLMKTGSFVKDTGKAARQFEQSMDRMQATAKRAGTAIGLAISAGITSTSAAAVAWSRQVADLSVQYERMGTLAGTSSEAFQRMAAGANVVGISHEKLADILKDVQDKIGDYVQTGGGAMADFFDNIARRTGVTAEQMRKLSGPDALGLYFNSLERANLSQSEMTFYMEAIASDSSMLMPLLRNNSAGFRQWGDAAEAAGAIIDGKTTKATVRLREITQEADLAMMGLKVSVAEELLPTLNNLTEFMASQQTRNAFASATKWVAELTGEMANGAVQIVNLIGRYAELQALEGASSDSLSSATEDALNEKMGELGARRRLLLSVESPSAERDKEAERLQAERVRIQRELTRRYGPQVTLIDNGQMLPDSALKSASVGYKPTGNIDKGAGDKAADEAKRRADEMARYRQQAEEAAGAMDGPLAEAMAKHLGNMAEYNDLLSKGNIAQADANVLMGQSALEYAKVAAEVEKAMGGPEQLLATFDSELVMLGKVGRARELYRRQLVNEKDMRDELQKAVEAAGSKEALALAKGASSYAEYERAMLDAAAAAAELSLQVEESAAHAEALANVIVSGLSDGVDAFADFAADGLRNFDNLWDDLKNVAKRGLRDMIEEIAKQKLIIPIQTQIMNGISGQGGGLSLQSIMGLFGGNGTAAGGQNASTIAGLLSQGQGLFGGASAAGSATAANSLGGSMASLAALTGGGTASTGAATGAAGAATGALAGVAAFAPYAALIAMGMQMAGSAYKEGFGLENQNKMDLLNRGHLASGGLLTPVMIDSMSLDYLGRALGMSSKTAAIFSGSSLMGKAFGRSAPKITGQGITGSYGFGGLDGQSYAEVKQKGGWFRSDKKWTQYGTLDPGIDRTFDMAARQIRGATTDLAKQLGVDLTRKLASVRVDLGKLQMSSDSEEAQKQLEAYLADMQDRLFTEAVKASGFGGQLDGYFGSADVFNALSASIELAVGNADDLGRALTGLEIDKVNKAVDYFQDLASVAGTDLATQIQKVTGLLGNYATLMADVSTQLLTGDLSSYQQQALTIERTYRQQVKAANDYAKALGLSGARAEDLAKIEALRAMNMGKLQAQIDKDKKAMQYGLSISDLSPLTDQEKLGEAMKELERAVAGGDTSAAQAAAQAALDFGRNLYASGQDYNGLYDQVTGLIDGMKVGDLDMEDGTSMGALADVIEALPDNFSRAVFDLVVDSNGQAQTTAAVQQSNALLTDVKGLLQDLLSTTTQGVRAASSSDLRKGLNAR